MSAVDVATLRAVLVADTSAYNRGLDRADNRANRFERSTSRAFHRVGGAARTMGKVGAVALAAGLAVGFKKATEEAREAAKVTAQTNAAIKSTGGAAKVTAKDIERLANSVSIKAGKDDEAIQSAANLMLTFTKVRNEVGKGNDVFSRSIPIIADVSAAFHKDLNASAVMVGKALNDPIKGISALSRVGIQFTKQQKDQIKTLVESGKTLEAQKIIMKELETQTKGSAEANADPFDKWRVAVDNLAESFGKTFLPVLSDAAEAVADFIDDMGTGEGFGGGLVDGAKKAFEEVKRVFESGFGTAPMLGPFQLPDDRTLGTKITESIAAGLRQAFAELMNSDILGGLVKVVGKALDSAFDPRWIADHIGDLLTIALAIIPIGKITKIPGLKWLADNLWIGLRAALKFGGKSLGTFLWGIVEGAFNYLIKNSPKLGWKLGEVLGDVASLSWKSVSGRFTGLGKNIAGKIGAGIASAGVAVGRAAAGLVGKVISAVKNSPVGRLGSWVGGKIRDGVAGLWKKFYSLGGFLLGKIKDGLIDAPLNGLKSLGSRIGKTIQSGIGRVKATLGIGGVGGGNVGPLGKDKGGLGSATALASQYGNIVTSGYRPGDPGWHGQNRARDYAGGNMIGFARAAASRFGGRLKELIHTPLGFGIKNGKRVPLSYWGAAVNKDHYDHVHVAMRRGGKAGPGQGGPSVVYGEGKKTEWWVSQEGNRKKNIGYAMEALSSLTRGRMAMFKDGGKIGPGGLKSLWTKAGGSSKIATTMAAIAMAESGGNPRATNNNSNGTVDRGLWQINSVHGYKGNMFNPLTNARAALKVYKKQGLGAWVVYNTGAYKKFMGAAGKAKAGRGGGGSQHVATNGFNVGSNVIAGPDSGAPDNYLNNGSFGGVGNALGVSPSSGGSEGSAGDPATILAEIRDELRRQNNIGDATRNIVRGQIEGAVLDFFNKGIGGRLAGGSRLASAGVSY